MVDPVIFSSESEVWETPKDLFEKLESWNGKFDLDPCTNGTNSKCENFFTEEQNALEQDWTKFSNIFMNPPYGRKIGPFIEKAYKTSVQRTGTRVVCLIPVRSDTKWWHNYVMKSQQMLQCLVVLLCLI